MSPPNFHTAVERAAISSPKPKVRELAISRLSKGGDVSALINVLKSRYADAVEKAELALAGYSFK
ncbi:hypothetical protein HY988_00935 [Candidatus Micrarchaeota archaeon]|nr:hypothetical protein [Candidatus Micrarchaeota archaeon]